MRKLKITLPDKTEIISTYSFKRVKIDETAITVLNAAYPGRYDSKVLNTDTYRWSISLGQEALDKFTELFKAKGIEFVPLLPGKSEGNIHFDNVYVIIDTIDDPVLPQLLIGIAIFAICSKLLAKHEDSMDRYISYISSDIVGCITKDGYWDTDRLRRLWGVLNYYFAYVLDCKFEEIN